MCDSKKTCLIIPCYNEELRLDLNEFKKHSADTLVFIFVNDGSTDNTLKLLESNAGKNWYVLNLHENKGKSEAIRQGALFLLNDDLYKQVDWFGFLDSDLSVPLHEVVNFYKYADSFNSDADCIIGSRVKRMGSEIVRSASRHYLGRVFCTLISFLFSIDYYDTQCGAKLFRKELIEAGFTQPFTSNWIFDIELLLRIKNYTVIEYPLQEWREKTGSKINFFTVWFEVLHDLIRLKRLQK